MKELFKVMLIVAVVFGVTWSASATDVIDETFESYPGFDENWTEWSSGSIDPDGDHPNCGTVGNSNAGCNIGHFSSIENYTCYIEKYITSTTTMQLELDIYLSTDGWDQGDWKKIIGIGNSTIYIRVAVKQKDGYSRILVQKLTDSGWQSADWIDTNDTPALWSIEDWFRLKFAVNTTTDILNWYIWDETSETYTHLGQHALGKDESDVTQVEVGILCGNISMNESQDMYVDDLLVKDVID